MDFVKTTAINANQGLDEINLCTDVLLGTKTSLFDFFWIKYTGTRLQQWCYHIEKKMLLEAFPPSLNYAYISLIQVNVPRWKRDKTFHSGIPATVLKIKLPFKVVLQIKPSTQHYRLRISFFKCSPGNAQICNTTIYQNTKRRATTLQILVSIKFDFVHMINNIKLKRTIGMLKISHYLTSL